MGMIFRGLTFGGVNSLDYGIFITGEAVYNAPERSVTSIEIEGRNGDLLIDNGRFLNIEVSYPAGCFAETQQDFKEKIELFRNAIVSQISYQRLTDDYNPDEYRLAVYKSGLDVNVAVLHQGGEFKLTFDCKPQRFLTSGETEKSIPDWSDIHSDSGSIVTIDNSSGEYAVKSLSTDIEPQQDLNGYDNPWAGGAGKNKIIQPYSDNYTNTVQGVTFTKNADGSIKAVGTVTTAGDYTFYTDAIAGNGGYTGSFILNGITGGSSATYRFGVRIRNTQTATNRYVFVDSGDSEVITTGENEIINRLYIAFKVNANVNTTFYPMLRLSSVTDATYAPYENICPITGFDSANIYVSPTTSVGDATTYNVSFGSAGTVYGGTLDVLTGVLTVERFFKAFNGLESWATAGTISGSTYRFYITWEHIGISGGVVNQDQLLCSHLVYLSGNTGSFGTFNVSATSFTVKDSDGSHFADATELTNWLSDQNTAGTPLEICVELATPQTYQLTATQVALLLGANNLWSDTGDIQIEYGKGGYTLFNPTLFDSRPLIELTGAGTLGINNYIITITGSGKLYIDCDTMEAYTIIGGIVTSANNRVSLNTTDYPVLRSGMNNFTVGTGISNVKITPRWWRI